MLPDHGSCRLGMGQQLRMIGLRAELARVKLGNEASTTTRDVHDLADQIGIHAILKIFEIEIDIVDPRTQLRREVITQVFRMQMIEVGARRDERATRLGHFLSVYG